MLFFKKAYEDIRTFRKILISLIAICLFVGVASVAFYSQVKQSAQEESEHYLREISSRIANNAERTISHNFSILETMKSILVGQGKVDASFAQIGNFIKQQESNWDFTKVIIIDNIGIAYDFKGNEVSITGDSFLRALSTEENTIAPSQIINNEEMLIFAIPLEQLQIEGKEMVALATCYNPDEFDKILSLSSFDEQSYSYIVDSKGKVIVRSSSAYGNKYGYNIVNTIKNDDSNATNEMNALLKDMQNNKNGQQQFTIGDAKEYLVYTPISIKGWYLFNFVPVSIVNEKTNLLLQSTLLMIGLVFFVFFILLVIIVGSFSRHRRRLEQIAYVDPLTKGNTIQKFSELVEEELVEEKNNYALIFTNIQKFKVLNDQFGRDICDVIIVGAHHALVSNLHEGEHIGHMSADNFLILLTYQDEETLLERILSWKDSVKKYFEQQNLVVPQYIIEYGIYILDDYKLPLTDMIDRARLALKDNVKNHPSHDYIHYSFYDDASRHRLVMEKHLEDMMETALHENEFQVYLQPKYLLSENEIGGAEALVRWQSKQDGMIFPDRFIPLFEKDGFIIKLDLWVFEQVCKLIQKWIKDGKKPIKISVNCSRVHLKDDNFLSYYINIFNKYHIPAKYIELEFTENMVFEDTERLIRVIDAIHEFGFGCSMDDFGSGHSSLNLLQEIHVDTLKLDRIFFKNSLEDDARTQAIISCVLEMAQSLQMATVAEGIEISEQVEILKKMGCDYVQGYVFAKPMPIVEFETLLFGDEEM